MAFTYVETKRGVMGDLRYQVFECTFGAVTTGHIPTGLSNIFYVDFNNEVTEADGLVRKNKASNGSTDAYGGVYFSGFTASDVATVMVFGK